MKFCQECVHLVDESLETCPLCGGQSWGDPEPSPSDDQDTKPESPRAKRLRK
jgi:hypothetical protein